MIKISDYEYKKCAMQISVASMAVNILLSGLKLICGILGSSSAMVSDSIHSLSDVFSTIIVIIGVKLASKKSDADHRYGHERLECLAAVILSVMLGIVGLSLGASGVRTMISGDLTAVPSLMAAAAAVISIVTKELMYIITKKTAERINSSALMADAGHHRSDALSSVGSLIGIMGARIGFPLLDPLASVVICLLILHSAYEIFKDAADKMVDKSCDKKTEESMAKKVLETKGVLSLDVIRTRLFGSKIYVDMEISADGDLSLREAHKIAQNVHDKIERDFPLVKHCMIHVNPK